jgi:hypothetical protein
MGKLCIKLNGSGLGPVRQRKPINFALDPFHGFLVVLTSEFWLLTYNSCFYYMAPDPIRRQRVLPARALPGKTKKTAPLTFDC